MHTFQWNEPREMITSCYMYISQWKTSYTINLVLVAIKEDKNGMFSMKLFWPHYHALRRHYTVDFVGFKKR